MSPGAIVDALLENDDLKAWLRSFVPKEHNQALAEYVGGYLLDYAQNNGLNKLGFEHALDKVLRVLAGEGIVDASGIDVFTVFWAMEQAGYGNAADMEAEFFEE